MLLGMTSRFICNLSSHLYPAYASYKALSGRPASSPTNGGPPPNPQLEVERWLMYWAVVGTWTGVEGVAGWLISWIPFYSLFKCLFFLWLSLPQTQGSTVIFESLLGPFFDEHERDIDAFLASLKSRAGGAVLGLGSWGVQKVREFLNASVNPNAVGSSGSYSGNSAGGVQGNIGDGSRWGFATSPQPPTMQDPASGMMQQAFTFATHYASRYLPLAASAIASASAAAGKSVADASPVASRFLSNAPEGAPVQGYVTMPVPIPTGPNVDQTVPSSFAGRRTSSSNTMRHASASFTSAVQTPTADQDGRLRPTGGRRSVSNSNSGSEQELARMSPHSTGSGNSRGSGGNWGGASGYEEITKEEVIYDEARQQQPGDDRPRHERRGSSWFGWGGTPEKEKTQ